MCSTACSAVHYDYVRETFKFKILSETQSNVNINTIFVSNVQ